MREIKYLSPSSVAKFYGNREQFYLQYLCPFKNPRPIQADYMAMGSGFDAFVKSNIYSDVYGPSALKGSEFEFDTIFEQQVEAPNRDLAFKICTDIWEQYRDSGAYDNLIRDILDSPYAPQMEWKVEGTINGVPLMGKPDLRYITKEGVHVIADFKVNGSMSGTGASPHQGYKVCYSPHDAKTHGKSHAKYKPMQLGDVEINEGYLEVFCDYWADQLSTYAWMLGEEVGSENFVVRMEQLAMRPVKKRDLPRGKFASHLSRVSELYQLELWEKYHTAWSIIQSGHIFTDMSREDSDMKCQLLDGRAQTPKSLFPQLFKDSDAPRFFNVKKG